ncbi:MAG: DUF2789 domain-containing protein [Betaproteobacteria bacterium]|nr:DUF2789 domain-containing protein [Betaproteobacteria bacterium]
MDTDFHRLPALFAQLGLPDDELSIRSFIAGHAPLAGDVLLAEAWFWSPAQARLLRESLCQDADWSQVVDRLDVALRGS